VIQTVTQKVEDVSRFKKIRRDVARLLTETSARRIAPLRRRRCRGRRRRHSCEGRRPELEQELHEEARPDR
jgi:hypothetical protein